MNTERIIAHLDLDAFFASVEQAVNPALRGKPVLVSGHGGTIRTVVAAASYEAKRLGIDSAMRLGEALRLCPRAVVVPADTARYVHTSDRILKILLAFTPQVDPASIDEFYLDITQTAGRFGGTVSLARQIKKRIQQEFHITASVGIAPNRLLAKVICKKGKPDGLLTLAPGEVIDFLDALPASDLCGVGPAMRGHLRTMGLFTCRDVRHAPIGLLAKNFGVWGYWLAQAARGQDDNPVPIYGEEDAGLSIGHSQTLPRDCRDLDILRGWLALLSERVAMRLRRRFVTGHNVSLTVRDAGFITRGRQKRFHIPTADGKEILERAWALFPADWRLRPIRLIGVSVSELTSDRQLVFLKEELRRRDLLRAVDTIRQKFGEFSVIPTSALVTQERSPRYIGRD